MDLLSQTPLGKVPIGSNITEVPPANTPAPYNAAFLGAADGTGPANASKNMAWLYNMVVVELVNVIKRAGLVPDVNNWAQIGQAVQKMINDGLVGLPTAVQVQYQDEGVNLGTAGTADVINFVGGDVLVTRTGNTITVKLPGSALGTKHVLAANGLADLTRNFTDVDTTAGNVTVNLPPVSTWTKSEHHVSWIAGTNTVFIATSGGDLINGQASIDMVYRPPLAGVWPVYKLRALAGEVRVV